MPTSGQLFFSVTLLLGFGLMAGIWIAIAVKSHRLLRAFKEKMPQQALVVFPEVFTAGRHPKKIWFFFTKEAADVMAADPRLGKMRSQFVRMAVVSLAVPALFAFAAIVGVVILRLR
ncbi:MAG: hypothetical protein WBY94_28820 [Polyangiaceae bacterium]